MFVKMYILEITNKSNDIKNINQIMVAGKFSGFWLSSLFQLACNDSSMLNFDCRGLSKNTNDQWVLTTCFTVLVNVYSVV